MSAYVAGDKIPLAFAVNFWAGGIELEKLVVENVIWSMALESRSHASLLATVDGK